MILDPISDSIFRGPAAVYYGALKTAVMLIYKMLKKKDWFRDRMV